LAGTRREKKEVKMFKLLSSILLSKPEVRVWIKEKEVRKERVEVVILPSPIKGWAKGEEKRLIIRKGSNCWRADVRDVSPKELEELLEARLGSIVPQKMIVEYGEGGAVRKERKRLQSFLAGVLGRI